jgi:tetratricopeptide (TPR) repeat protein
MTETRIADSLSFRIALRAVVVVVAAFALYRYSIVPMSANRTLKDIELRTRGALDGGISEDRSVMIARDNIERLGRFEPRCLLAVEYHMLWAGNARILHRTDDALAHYTLALALEHRPEIYFERGLTYLEKGNVDAATADVARAARFNPNYITEIDSEFQRRVIAAIPKQ